MPSEQPEDATPRSGGETRTPHAVQEALALTARRGITAAMLCILAVIQRETFGWATRVGPWPISTADFMRRTGLARSTVLASLDALAAEGVVVVVPGRGNKPDAYAINPDPTGWGRYAPSAPSAARNRRGPVRRTAPGPVEQTPSGPGEQTGSGPVEQTAAADEIPAPGPAEQTGSGPVEQTARGPVEQTEEAAQADAGEGVTTGRSKTKQGTKKRQRAARDLTEEEETTNRDARALVALVVEKGLHGKYPKGGSWYAQQIGRAKQLVAGGGLAYWSDVVEAMRQFWKYRDPRSAFDVFKLGQDGPLAAAEAGIEEGTPEAQDPNAIQWAL